MTKPINVTITGGNFRKSAAVAEAVTEALTKKGFTNASYVNSTPPKLQAVSKAGETASLLEQIQKTYPNFLDDPIHVWAIPVIGINDDVEINTDLQATAIDFDGEATQIFIPNGLVGLDGKLPPPLVQKDNPEITAVVKRAAKIAIERDVEMGDDVFRQAAQQLKDEGVIGAPKTSHLKVVDIIPEAT